MKKLSTIFSIENLLSDGLHILPFGSSCHITAVMTTKAANIQNRCMWKKIIRGKIKLHVAGYLVDFLVAVVGLAPNGLLDYGAAALLPG